jgi:hypothetical protein
VLGRRAGWTAAKSRNASPSASPATATRGCAARRSTPAVRGLAPGRCAGGGRQRRRRDGSPVCEDARRWLSLPLVTPWSRAGVSRPRATRHPRRRRRRLARLHR